MGRMTMRGATGLVLGALLFAGTAYGGDDAVPPGAAPAGRDATLDISIRARTLGIGPDTLPAPSLDLEAQRAPTGAGSLRWPSETMEVARGVYVHVMPRCIPGVDDFPALPGRRSPARR
jgi:hypothetical protein